MKLKSILRTGALRLTTFGLFSAAVSTVYGQAAPGAAPVAAPPATGEVVELTAFEVAADRDDSYGALNSASITRFNVAMEDMPVSADIFTETFMRDVGATSIEEVVQGYSAGAGYAAADGEASGAVSAQPGDRNANTYIQIRGMNTPVIQRDSFMPVGTFGNPGSTGVGRTDNFDIERVEVINGPQALLYGGGGAGGVINVTSKQARFGRGEGLFGNFGGQALYRVDNFGSKRGEFDFGFGNTWFAARFAFLAERSKSRRVHIGGDTFGQYGQLAFRFFQKTVPTTMRLSGSFTQNERWLSRTINLNASGDPRNNHQLRYLLATGQAGATNPTTGAPYPKGAILNGGLNWGNVDSFAAGKMQQDPIKNHYGSLTADTKWSDWLTTQLAVGYDKYQENRLNPGLTFYAPRSAQNTTEEWTGSITPSDSWQPARTKGGRFAALMTHGLWGEKGKSQTLVGIDYIDTEFAQDQYQWYQADANWNIIRAPGSTLTSPNSGRTPLGRLFWSLEDGPVLDPIPSFNQANIRGTVNGVNYVRALRNTPDPSLVTPDNPLGVPFSAGNYIKTSVTNRGYYGVNYTRWFEGKLNTLVGLRQGSYRSLRLNHPDGGRTTWLAETTATNFNIGIDYNFNRWLQPYINYSDSVSLPYVANRSDPHNAEPQSSRGKGGELGLKLTNASGTLSGSFSVFRTRSENDLYRINGSIADAINPTGLNGGGGGEHVSIDRETQGAELRLTAAPTRNWRIRFGAAFNDGEIGTTKSYDQRYNDQFYTNAAGQVTYRNGTVVYVNGSAGSATQATVVSPAAPGAVPLTINLMSTPGGSNLYFANPDPTSGSIDRGSITGGILRGLNNDAAIQANGPILTGTVNLPISAVQLNKTLAGINTPGTILATRVGDKTAGYPEYSANFTSKYTFSGDHWLKGFGIGGTVSFSWKNRSYYYYATPVTATNALTLQRTLLYLPDTQQLNLVLSYSRKIGRYEWTSQLNVSNVFNRYQVLLFPDGATGFNDTRNISAAFYQQPRSYLWTNTLRF